MQSILIAAFILAVPFAAESPRVVMKQMVITAAAYGIKPIKPIPGVPQPAPQKPAPKKPAPK